ncbi:p-loop containing nucleoside triphosphate hydrolase [Venustampulla echinocandica]|uniref:Chromatin-remodeling ATPase INO80 n=1 Tax=Venustampulla echinocandica TaxID=2656787 RepID=A0A370TY67_9HELO|nr:p-loop containing nucleoside triphosphate hydrolase [Venustampulla echinocandica]RDL40476.1 p-loop containing nucleoside triphosphate hydrolase [Venustampulla echinocandica]
MYHSTVMQRPHEDEDDGGRRERERLNINGASSSSSNSRPYDAARSPTQTQTHADHQSQSQSHSQPPSRSSFSPTNGTHPRPQFANNSYHPPTPAPAPAPAPLQMPMSMPGASHIPGHPTSPMPLASTTPSATYHNDYQPQAQTQPAARDKPVSNYYDPTSDSGERRPSEGNVQAQTPQNRDPYTFPPPSADAPKYYNGSHTSPVSSTFPPPSPISHSHPQGRPVSQSPSAAAMASPVARQNGVAMAGPSLKQEPAVPTTVRVSHPRPPKISHLRGSQTPSRTADPMSFSSILSSAEPPPKPTLTPTVTKGRKPSKQPLPPPPAPESMSRESSQQSTAPPAPTPIASRIPAKRKANGEAKKNSPKPKVLKEQEKEIAALAAQLDAEASDADMPDYEVDKKLFQARGLKRKLDVEKAELGKVKQRRRNFTQAMAGKLTRHALLGEQRYRDIHADAAVTAVQEKEVQAEKERKKDMQRKRRREKTITTNMEQKQLALAKAQEARDEEERQKFIREALRAEKKAQQTKLILQRGDKRLDMKAGSPLEPNLSGGMMSTFPTADAEAQPPKTKSKRGGARLRKSKEQKQAEKDSAEAAQAAIDAGEEPPPPPPVKDEPPTKIRLKVKEPKEPKEEPPAFEPYVSKGYNQIYDQIWRDLARKDVNKVYKLAAESYATRVSNLKKTAILASKEAKRWQLRTNKGTKDLQARAKRVMREMMSFWKRNEREERDLRRAAEKQEIENAKKAEADREANRQKRKLNFLISQTELYSHFIGKKIKTDEVERSTDHPDVAAAAGATPGHPKGPTIDVSHGTVGAKVTNFEDLDFDAEDESALTAAAMANAQNAIQEAQNKARAFNKQDEGPDMDEEGEMNFQNPAGMGDVDIEQPKMLQAQLKEYQLKGLNWLVNLYEQGINGILADEMGLGKTVQSISVMAYLAEKHGIWGPFLVVAPASTLHNWQQEIAKFVPTLKVLPYWGTAADRKVLRKFWDRKHITYTQDAPFHVLVTSYQLVVSDVNYFQKMKWQYMILDEAQAIKSSQSSRWKSLLGFHCRNRLLLTGTPIQNNMQELWALLHFIMPSLFDSHDEFSEWFSKDIESHAQSNTKLNEDQLKRLHMILKPFMLRRVKKHVQKELGDKIELDIFCDLTYRQRAYYTNLRNQISIMDLIEKATVGDDNDTGTLMNLVMQFRKVCNHPDLFQRAETTSPFSFGYFAETASFMREGPNINVGYSTRNLIEYCLPKLIWREGGRLDLPGDDNEKAGFNSRYLEQLMNVWNPENILENADGNGAFSWLKFSDTSAKEVSAAGRKSVFNRAVELAQKPRRLDTLNVIYDEEEEKNFTPSHAMLRIVDRQERKALAEVTNEGYLNKLFNVAKTSWANSGVGRLEQCGRPAASAPPIEVFCSSPGAIIEKENLMFNMPVRRALYGPSPVEEKALVTAKIPPTFYPPTKMLPAPTSEKQRFTNILVPSMRRFVTDSGKLAKLDELLFKLKEGGHRVLLYFQMTRMIDLMEEYLTYRNYKYLRLDGSTKLEDRRDTVHDFQTRPEIFIFLLSTRAGGLGINLTSADTVIFYDSDWNPTIDSQAMDRAHRLGQTRQVTVYRMITRGTIEERIRKRALQKEEVQKVVMTGGAGVDFNTRSKENRTKDIAMWLVDDDEAAEIERKEAELAAQEAKEPVVGKKGKGRKRKAETGGSLEDLYHEGEGHFDDGSNRPSGAATPIPGSGDAALGAKGKKPRKAGGKKAKTAKQRLAMADGDVDMG